MLYCWNVKVQTVAGHPVSAGNDNEVARCDVMPAPAADIGRRLKVHSDVPRISGLLQYIAKPTSSRVKSNQSTPAMYQNSHN